MTNTPHDNNNIYTNLNVPKLSPGTRKSFTQFVPWTAGKVVVPTGQGPGTDGLVYFLTEQTIPDLDRAGYVYCQNYTDSYIYALNGHTARANAEVLMSQSRAAIPPFSAGLIPVDTSETSLPLLCACYGMDFTTPRPFIPNGIPEYARGPGAYVTLSSYGDSDNMPMGRLAQQYVRMYDIYDYASQMGGGYIAGLAAVAANARFLYGTIDTAGASAVYAYFATTTTATVTATRQILTPGLSPQGALEETQSLTTGVGGSGVTVFKFTYDSWGADYITLTNTGAGPMDIVDAGVFAVFK